MNDRISELQTEIAELYNQKDLIQKQINNKHHEIAKIRLFEDFNLKEGSIIKYKGKVGLVSIQDVHPMIQYKNKDGKFSKSKQYLFNLEGNYEILNETN